MIVGFAAFATVGRFKRIGLPDEFAVLGKTDEVYHYYGLDPEGIANTVFDLMTK